MTENGRLKTCFETAILFIECSVSYTERCFKRLTFKTIIKRVGA